MSQKQLKALRKLTNFKPSSAKTYKKIKQAHKVYTYTDIKGVDQTIEIPRFAIVNEQKAAYSIAKKRYIIEGR